MSLYIQSSELTSEYPTYGSSHLLMFWKAVEVEFISTSTEMVSFGVYHLSCFPSTYLFIY